MMLLAWQSKPSLQIGLAFDGVAVFSVLLVVVVVVVVVISLAVVPPFGAQLPVLMLSTHDGLATGIFDFIAHFGVRVQRSYRLLLGTTWGHGAGLVDWWIGGLVDGEMGGWGDGWIAAYCRKGAFRFMVRNADFEQPQKPGPAHFFHLDLP